MSDLFDLKVLLDESNALQNEAIACIAEIDASEVLLRDVQERWDNIYNDFVANQESIPVPGGGKWNDDKRLAYVKSENQSAWTTLQNTKAQLRVANLRMKLASEKISGLNRRLRLFELAVTDDYNKSTLLKLGLTQV